MPRTASQLLWGLPLATMAAGLLVALWPASEPAPPTPTGASPAVVAPRPATTVPPPLAAASSTAAEPRATDPSHGLSPEEHRTLASALADHPAREAEMRRIAGFLQLQRQVDAWSASRAAQALPATRRALADRIEAALPAALAARSVGAGEALQLQAQLIADREPDAARAGTELAAWRARHVPAPQGPDGAEREFLAQQQRLVAAYSGQPDRLEPALDALRRKHFANPN